MIFSIVCTCTCISCKLFQLFKIAFRLTSMQSFHFVPSVQADYLTGILNSSLITISQYQRYLNVVDNLVGDIEPGATVQQIEALIDNLGDFLLVNNISNTEVCSLSLSFSFSLSVSLSPPLSPSFPLILSLFLCVLWLLLSMCVNVPKIWLFHAVVIIQTMLFHYINHSLIIIRSINFLVSSTMQIQLELGFNLSLSATTKIR